MRKLILGLLVACVAFVAQASDVSAQSSKKKMTKPAQTTMMKQDTMMKKESVSRAFTNGHNVPSTGVAIEGYCPVCYLAANKAVKGSKEISYDHEGITDWFVNEGARDTFSKTPGKYVPAYGGWCALGAAMGQRFPVDPTNFKIVDGRIMLFLKNAKVDGVGLWNQDEAGNLKKADTNWVKLKG